MSRRSALVACLLAAGISALRVVSNGSEPPQPVATKDGKAANSSDAARAQEPAAAASSEDQAPIQKKLDAVVTLNIPVCTPLSEAADSIAKQYKINVLLDHKALNDASVAELEPVHVNLSNVSLRRALRSLLHDLDLDFYVASDGVLLITTADVAKTAVTAHVYDVRDLLATRTAEDGSTSPCADDLIAMITSCVAPTTWDSAGGPGSVNDELGTLAIRQTEPIHEHIAGLLAALRHVQRTAGSNKPVAAGRSQDVQAADAIGTKLGRQQDVHTKEMHTFLASEEMTLVELQRWLTAQGIPTLLDIRALTDASISPASTVPDCDLKQVRLDWALRWLLKQRDLNYYIDGEVLVVTTAEKAKATTRTVVYPIGDLTDAVLPGSAADANAPDYDDVMNTITANIAPSSWDSAGGNGSIAMLPAAKALVCSQTGEIQQQICQMLADLRAQIASHKPGAEKPAESPDVPVVRVYFLTSPVVAPVNVPAKGSGTNAPAKETAAKEPTAKEAATNDAQTARYISVITALVEPKSWTDGSGYIAAVPGAIVVRQTPDVQKRIGALLVKLGAMQAATPYDQSRSAPGPCGGLVQREYGGSGFGGSGRGGGAAFSIRPLPSAASTK